MTHINYLTQDIEKQLTKRNWFDDRLVSEFTDEIASRLKGQYNSPERKPGLRLSQMGPRCPRALWYSIHKPELAEPMPPWVQMKFSFGHIIEGLAVGLAKAAGHEVTGEQDAVFVDGVEGHRDCIIDGCVVDVKSASSIAFKKYKNGFKAEDDSFGYLDQLDAYLVGSIEDPLVRVKDRGYFLFIDKQLGHMHLHEHKLRSDSIKDRVAKYKTIVANVEPPRCNCGTVADGNSGNYALDLRASYSPYKYCCFPNLRTFLYSGGPRYLAQVVKRPMYAGKPLVEIDRFGQIINC